MRNTVIHTENITSGYGEVQVLRDISLEIYENEITVILGVSGCGKTTLLKHLIGLMSPRQGTIRIFDTNIVGMDEADYNLLMKRVGVLFQGGALLNSITVADNVAIPLEQHTRLSREIIDDIVNLKLGLVGLADAGGLLPSQLSGGMRKRAALARAIALDPAVLFADEPTAGLDPVTASSLDRLLLSLHQLLGMTLVIVTHELASIRRVADRIVYIDRGSILFTGTLEEAERSEITEVREFFMPETATSEE
jgi:phospholipid/cholesterol/gamma-HCH transport system ATP-binding protein